MRACGGGQRVAPEIIAFVNQKGGVGKTTTAVSLAAALGRRGERVLLIDLDAQANATSAAGLAEVTGPSIYEVLMQEADARDCIVRMEDEQFDLLPATRELSGAEVELAPAMAREQRLKNICAPLADDYDWIFVDSPPSLGVLTVNALTAATSVVIPVQCEYLPMEGLARLMETLTLVRSNLNPGLRTLGLVLTMLDRRTRLAREVAADVMTHFPNQTFSTVIPRAVSIAEAPSYGQSIFRYSPGSRAATAYRRLANELTERVGVSA